MTEPFVDVFNVFMFYEFHTQSLIEKKTWLMLGYNGVFIQSSTVAIKMFCIFFVPNAVKIIVKFRLYWPQSSNWGKQFSRIIEFMKPVQKTILEIINFHQIKYYEDRKLNSPWVTKKSFSSIILHSQQLVLPITSRLSYILTPSKKSILFDKLMFVMWWLILYFDVIFGYS